MIQKSEIILTGLLITTLALGAVTYYMLDATRKSAFEKETMLTTELGGVHGDLVTAQTRIHELEGVLSETQALLQQTVDAKDGITQNLTEEKAKNTAFEKQINKIGSTVGTLDKLSKIDTELLMKYSKIYFLNEHYMPEKLSEISTTYLYNEKEPKFIHAKVKPFLKKLLDDALDDGIKIWVTSAFRSFDEQKDLKSRYAISYGSGANTFSADQGYSEHQLGTTLDLTTEGLHGGIDGFENTKAYTWLTENAYKYGFTLSYPKNNAYYIFEPWHWRFVGTDLARVLHKKSMYFYDMDQRDIDTYLISLFD